MENASKALLIAGGALIAVIILSIGLYLYGIFSENALDLQEQLEKDRISKFNNQFTAYLGRENLTIYDVIDIANIANENNQKLGLTINDKGNQTTYYINVLLTRNKKTIDAENLVDSQKENWVKEDISKIDKSTQELPKYECENIYTSTTTQRVYQIIIKNI